MYANCTGTGAGVQQFPEASATAGIALGTAVERHSADPDLVNRGHGYGMPCRGFDGNDIEQVVAEVGDAAALARAGGGPTYLVARTARLRGFIMSDPMSYRTREQQRELAAREPIGRYAARLAECGLIDEEGLKRLAAEAATVVDDAVDFADNDADATVKTRFDHVLAG